MELFRAMGIVFATEHNVKAFQDGGLSVHTILEAGVIRQASRNTPRDGVLTSYSGRLAIVDHCGQQWIIVGQSTSGSPEVGYDGWLAAYTPEEWVNRLKLKGIIS
jgi:hypothetical protein